MSRALSPKSAALTQENKGRVRIGESNPNMARQRPDSVTGKVRAAFQGGYTGTRLQLAAKLGLDAEAVRKAVGSLVTRREIRTVEQTATYTLRRTS